MLIIKTNTAVLTKFECNELNFVVISLNKVINPTLFPLKSAIGKEHDANSLLFSENLETV